MSYDPYDKLPRAAGETGYFEATDPRNYSTSFSAEPRDTSTASSATPITRQDDYPSSTHMQSSVDEAPPPPPTDHIIENAAPATVSPELIAVLTERIKKEVVEHLKQTGTIETPTEQPSHPPLRRKPSNKSSSTSSPPAPTDRKIYTPPSPTNSKPPKFSASSSSLPMGSRHSPPESPDEIPSTRYTDTRKPSGESHDEKETPKRPSVAGRTFSTAELSTVDQKWGRLFEADHTATPRLGQFLKGLANHIVDEYAPKKSIVITPEKMTQFYSNYALDREIHPMISIFKSGKDKQISGMYQDLSCQHHFIQERLDAPPTIPGLTPLGFAQWMTIAILAYPNEEAQRFKKVVVACPIDADGQMIDGKPERLPKQISRHLLPSREHKKSRQLFDEAIADFLEYAEQAPLPKRRATIHSPPISRRPSVSIASTFDSPLPSPLANPVERERMPYGGTPSAAVSDTSTVEDHPTGIERERKPYSVQPGVGKTYTETINLSAPPTADQRRNRANSTNERATPMDSRYSRSTASRPSRNRQSSPPLRGFGTSEPAIDTSGGYFAPSLNSANSAPSGYKNFPPAAHVSGSGGPYIPATATMHGLSGDSKDRGASVGSSEGRERERERDREREREKEREKERERDRDKDDDLERSKRYSTTSGTRDRERERERDRDRDRERERERDSQRERDTRKRDSYSHLPIPPLPQPRRSMTAEEEAAARLSFTSPRDAERYDRLYEGRVGGSGHGVGGVGAAGYAGEKGGVSYEDYYRDRDRDRGTRF